MMSTGTPLMWSLFAAFVLIALLVDFFAMEKPPVTETTALGAAYLAAVGMGQWTPAEIGRHWRLDKEFSPAMSAAARAAA